tara:strand:+ start:53 stop:646 length:594 start_codon:yes stop_codon:yes gene_type:complete
MSKRKAFNFYVSYFDTFNELSDADKLKFITALLNKQFLGIEPELKGISKLAYNSQKHSINQQVEGYENKTKQRLNKGGAIGGAEGGSVQEKEKGKEKEETTYEEKKEKFLNWFNIKKQKHTGKIGRFKVLTKTDDVNLKKLYKDYGAEEFEIAIKNLYKSKWAIQNNMLTPSHYLRVENFNKYLNQSDSVKRLNTFD